VLAVIGAGATGAWLFDRAPSPQRPSQPVLPNRAAQIRSTLFDELQPVTLSNCTLERLGEPNDGGYLVCGNLLDAVESGYSYGINGYDGWGCDVSRRLGIPVHQYDCFNTARPYCSGGTTVFHEECVADAAYLETGRRFDTIEGHIGANGDAGRRLILKIDVEGAEWGAFLQTPEALLDRIDQLVVEFHGFEEERFVLAVWRLKKFFHVANLHFNNASCVPDGSPFPAWAYEVLFVNRRIGVVSASATAPRAHGLDTPNHPEVPDCQKAGP
jgi:hypothetical protein